MVKEGGETIRIREGAEDEITKRLDFSMTIVTHQATCETLVFRSTGTPSGTNSTRHKKRMPMRYRQRQIKELLLIKTVIQTPDKAL